eukprot:gene3553-6165_t
MPHILHPPTRIYSLYYTDLPTSQYRPVPSMTDVGPCSYAFPFGADGLLLLPIPHNQHQKLHPQVTATEITCTVYRRGHRHCIDTHIYTPGRQPLCYM